MNELVARAHDLGYIFCSSDVFAIGYMAGKYGLETLLRDNKKLIEAIEEYDKTDDLGLLDTISETFKDLGVFNKASDCCNAPMIGDVQCENCGSDGIVAGHE